MQSGTMMEDTALRSFCAQQREWLELELQSEQDVVSPLSKEERSSHVLHQLQASDVSVGLYGRTVVRLISNQTESVAANSSSNESLLPAHKFTTGDEVEIRAKSSGSSKMNHPSGVVSQVTESSLSVALFPSQNHRHNENSRDVENDDNDDDIFGNPPLSVIPRSNVQVHRKLLAALEELETKGFDHPVSGRVVQALFDPSPSSELSFHNRPPDASTTGTQPFNTNLDASQVEAISFALTSNQPIALIHGPPGTGKTTTIVELIQQAVHVYGWKVLVTAPSNVAVDNVLARLVVVDPVKTKSSIGGSSSGSSKRHTKHSKVRVVRLGHPARLQEAILPYSLEAMVQAADGTDIVDSVRAELQSNLRLLSSSSSSSIPKKRRDTTAIKRQLVYREIKALRKEVRVREEKVVTELMTSAQVVLTTCVGAGNSKLLRDLQFDMVVIDEAAQALEAACWIPALQAKTKLVLAGDHLQLPPTIMSNAPLVQEGLSKTMFERVVELYDKNGGKHAISRMLKVQYRMHASIADWASQALYGGELQTHKSVEARTLGQLLLLDGATTRTSTTADLSRQQQQEGLEDESPLLLIDTAGCNMYESENAAGSRFNEGEAQIVVQHVRKLMAMGVQQDQIAVISPYNGQVEVLRLALLPEAPKLQIRSVDGFQGGEREAVVLSLVRSSECGGKQGIGFLRDDRRLNVAVTRAKRHCCVICDSETVSQSPFVKNLIQWMEEHGEQRSALEVLDQIDSVDLAQAELDLERLLQGAFKPSASVKKSSNRQQAPLDMEHRRHALLEKIRAFQSNAKQGDEMVMSAELSKLDRKLVHEIAEELGLGHLSEGVEGVNRKIKIIILPNNDLLAITPASTLPSATARSGSALMEESERSNTHGAVAGPGETPAQGEELDDDFEEIPENFVQQPTASVYAAFEVDEEDNGPSASEKVAEKPALNSVLANLTKERAERQKERDALQQDIAKKSKKKKGQKLGGGTKKLPASALNGVDYNAELDDLTFLNAQIDKVQNSHGRQVEGRGKSYRTIINGVLLAKPMSSSLTEKKKGVQASASLNNKLKEALDSRKAKPKKK